MLTLAEKIIFTLAVLATLYAAWRVIDRIVRTIGRGHGKPDWGLAQKRLIAVLAKTISLQPTFRLRIGPSLFHAFVAWGFMYYLLVNLGDVLSGFFPGFFFMGTGMIGNLYRYLADLLSVGALVGMTVLIVRRFVLRSNDLNTRENVLLWPEARISIRRGLGDRGGLYFGACRLAFPGRIGQNCLRWGHRTEWASRLRPCLGTFR